MLRRLRLASGLVLFAYLAWHLGNAGLAIVSLGTADAALVTVYPVLTSWPVTGVLLAALLTHFALALWALWQRRTLRLSAPEAAQYLLGFAIPLLLASHVVGTRVADGLFEADWGYYRNVVLALMVLDPWTGARQAALVLAAWTHACLGLHFWLRLKPWYPRWRMAALAGAVLLPALALAGLVAGGNEAGLRAATDPGFLMEARMAAPAPEVQPELKRIVAVARLSLLAAILLVLAARAVRRALQHRRGLVALTYENGRRVRVPRGVSVLEASWMNGIPHASVCGGRGRCSTCRVRVWAEPAALPSPDAEEARVLARVGAPAGVRLACQLRPLGPCTVAPLLDAALPPAELLRFREGARLGTEREIAILFADLRDFTQLAERRLPFDVVHLLNRYFRAMGEAVEAAGGRVDKFIGDGVMALFGAEAGGGGPAEACRAGLAAARLISRRLAELNAGFEAELGERLRIGIGLHAGPAIIGEMGHGRAMALTAIGDAVNTASRLEAACKQLGCELVVSEEVFARAGLAPVGEAHALEVRGRREALAVRAVMRAGELGEAVA